MYFNNALKNFFAKTLPIEARLLSGSPSCLMDSKQGGEVGDILSLNLLTVLQRHFWDHSSFPRLQLLILLRWKGALENHLHQRTPMGRTTWFRLTPSTANQYHQKCNFLEEAFGEKISFLFIFFQVALTPLHLLCFGHPWGNFCVWKSLNKMVPQNCWPPSPLLENAKKKTDLLYGCLLCVLVTFESPY